MRRETFAGKGPCRLLDVLNLDLLKQGFPFRYSGRTASAAFHPGHSGRFLPSSIFRRRPALFPFRLCSCTGEQKKRRHRCGTIVCVATGSGRRRMRASGARLAPLEPLVQAHLADGLPGLGELGRSPGVGPRCAAVLSASARFLYSTFLDTASAADLADALVRFYE